MNAPHEHIQDCYTAFLDILGFQSLIDQVTKNEIDIQYLLGILNHAKNFEKMSSTNSIGIVQKILNLVRKKFSGLDHDIFRSMFSVKSFSDSIIVSSEVSKISFDTFTDVVGYIWGVFAEHGILIRGGISRGWMMLGSDEIFGEGMVRSYQLESKIAVFPRIVLDPYLVVDDEGKDLRGFDCPKKTDGDGVVYLDVFRKRPPVYPTSKLQQTILSGLSNENDRIRKKYEWLNGELPDNFFTNYGQEIIMKQRGIAIEN